ncbi:secreted pullulanase [Fontibacillus solani]|uniref:pullulanase n=1 Tax=Fontibacillus solani TaxID=1572857 RepID=A0A7W3SPE4_9BACL|nr:pullulanase [Fontibacillus solani]MBA9083756.1 secreted pullulanase [Fontibacillus solani]
MNFAVKGKKSLSIFMIVALLLSCVGLSSTAASADVDSGMSALAAGSGTPVPEGHIRVHYNGEIKDNGLWLWDDVAAPSEVWSSDAIPFNSTDVDSYGPYVDVELASNAKKIGFLVVDRISKDKESGNKHLTITSATMNEVWIKVGSDTVYPYEPVNKDPNTVRIHYVRDDQTYRSYGLWLWKDVLTPSETIPLPFPKAATPFTADQVDRYGAYIDVPLKADAKQLGLLVVNPNKESDRDGGDKMFSLLDKYDHLWIYQGDDKVYISPYKELPVALLSAEAISDGKLLLNFTMTDGLDVAELESGLSIEDKNGTSVAVESVVITGSKTAEVNLSFSLDSFPLSVTYTGRTVVTTKGWRMLDEMYHYEGNDLGATYHGGKATFKLWAPTASSVTANVYDKDDANQYIGNVELALGDKGVWTADVDPTELNLSDLKGYYYQYQVTNNGVTKAVLDPYAKSMAAFTVQTTGQPGSGGDTVGKAAIVDLAGTDPEGFDYAQIDSYKKREDAVLWEIHVRDFTSDPAIEGDLSARWGSYAAFKDKLEYLKSLGVTHVQLLPVMAWYYGDETNMEERELEYSARDNQFNWGYDPHNYFSPDGAYSEDPTDPELRIKELKGLIDAVHEAGMGVVLDVVYTHMAKPDFLNDIVPNYYAWQDADGKFVGTFTNNLATNHKMAEKLMIDSVKYWFKEYKIDGMRWDMMGDATYESVQNAYNEAIKINPNALFTGEGWNTFSGNIADPSLEGKGATQAWMNKTDSVGVFSDEFRNELKSGYPNEGEPRFLTGGARDINVIFNNIKAQPSNTPSDDPGDILPYLEAHDNLTLHDIIAYTLKKDPTVPENELEIHKRLRLGNLMIMTSQGTAFLHAGQEYGRTKQWLADTEPEQKFHVMKDKDSNKTVYFISDSFDSTDVINKIDWGRATDAEKYPINNTTAKYTSGLIELRKSTDAFRLGDMNLVNNNVTLIKAPEIAANDVAIAYKNASTDGTGNYYVFMNGDNKERTFTIGEDLTSGKVLVDNDEAGATEVNNRSGFKLTSSSITLEPLTAVVINKKDNGSVPGTPPSGGTSYSGSGSGASVPASNSTTDALGKLLTNLPKDDAKAAEAIIAALNELGTVADVKAEDVKGTNVAAVNAAKLQTALNNLQKGLESVKKALAGNSKLLEKVKAGVSVTVKVADVSGTSVEVSVPADVLDKINQAGLAITLVTSDAVITIPANALEAAGAKEFKLTKKLIGETEAQSILNQAGIANQSLQPVSRMFGFTITVIDKNGNSSNLTTFNKNLNVFLQLTAQNLANLADKRKAGVYHIAADGLTNFKGGKFNGQQIHFLTDHFSNFIVLESTKTFGDTVGNWAKDYIEVLAARSITDGVTSDQFAPKGTVTRGQMAVFLGRALNIAEDSQGAAFTDVSGDQYYARYVNAMKLAGIMNGYEDGTFRPDQDVTREEMVTMIMKAYSYTTGETTAVESESGSFKDIHLVSEYAVNSLKAAASLGFVEGVADGYFEPKSLFTRAQMAKVLIKLMEKTGQF